MSQSLKKAIGNIGSTEESNLEEDEILARITEPSKDERERIENYHLAVSIAILTIYARVKTATNDLIFSQGETILGVLAFLSLSYLVGKTAAISVKPIVNSDWLDYFDYYILSLSFMASFAGASLLLFFNLLSTLADDLQLPLDEIMSVFELIIIGRFNAFYFVFVLATATVYACYTGKTMSSVSAEIPEVQFTYTSSPGGESLPITIENGLSKQVQASEIEISVDAPKNVDVQIPNAYPTESGKRWELLMPIPSGKEKTVQLEFSRAGDCDEISDSSVTVSIIYNGKNVSTHKVNVHG